jgi:hypothetical protein
MGFLDGLLGWTSWTGFLAGLLGRAYLVGFLAGVLGWTYNKENNYLFSLYFFRTF